jgi:hypothetical protein
MPRFANAAEQNQRSTFQKLLTPGLFAKYALNETVGRRGCDAAKILINTKHDTETRTEFAGLYSLVPTKDHTRPGRIRNLIVGENEIDFSTGNETRCDGHHEFSMVESGVVNTDIATRDRRDSGIRDIHMDRGDNSRDTWKV